MTFRRRTAVIVGTLLLSLAGCANPSLIGVQDFGTVTGNVVSSTGLPVTSALVSSTGSLQTAGTSAGGYFSLSDVAVGEQTVTVSAPGYLTATADVIVTKNASVSAGNVTLVVTTGTPVNH